MPGKTNHACCVCGGKYYFCNDCANFTTFTPWRKIACSRECYQAFLVINGFNYGEFSKEQAKQMLCDIDFDAQKVSEHVKGTIAMIMSEEETREHAAGADPSPELTEVAQDSVEHEFDTILSESVPSHKSRRKRTPTVSATES